MVVVVVVAVVVGTTVVVVGETAVAVGVVTVVVGGTVVVVVRTVVVVDGIVVVVGKRAKLWVGALVPGGLPAFGFQEGGFVVRCLRFHTVFACIVARRLAEARAATAVAWLFDLRAEAEVVEPD